MRLLLALVLLLSRQDSAQEKFDPVGSFDGHLGPVSKMRVAGKTLLTLGADGLRAWDLERQVVVGCVPGAFTFDVAPDGKEIAVGLRTQLKSITFCDVPSLKVRRKIDGEVEVGLFQYFAPAKMILGSTVPVIVDARTGKPDMAGFKDVVIQRVFVGSQMIAMSVQNEVRLYGKSGEVRRAIPWDQSLVELGGFDPAGKYFAGVSEGRLRVVSVDDRKELFAVKDHAGAVTDLAISGKYAVTGGADKMVRVYDMAGKKLVTKIEAGVPVLAIAVTGDGRVAVAGEDRTVKFYTIDKAAAAGDLGMPFDFEVVAGGADRFYLGDQRGNVRVLIPSTMKMEAPVAAHKGNVTAIAVGKDVIATGGTDEVVRVWKDGQLARKVEAPVTEVRELHFGPDGTTIYFAAMNQIRAWAADSDKAVVVYENPRGSVVSFAVSPDGKSFGVTDPRQVHLVDIASKADRLEVKRLNSSTRGQTLFLKDGSFVYRHEEWVAVAANEKLEETVRCDTMKGRDTIALTGPFAYDGKEMLATIASERVLVWDISKGTAFKALGCREKLKSIAFTADGKYLAVVTTSGNVVVWSVKP